MIAKGRYVGQIEFDFKVNLDESTATCDEFKMNLKCLNSNIEEALKPLLAENSDNIFSTMVVTQQYLDVYEVNDQDGRNN